MAKFEKHKCRKFVQRNYVLGVNGYSVNQKNIFEAQIIFMAFMCVKALRKQKVTCKICLKNKTMN